MVAWQTGRSRGLKLHLLFQSPEHKELFPADISIKTGNKKIIPVAEVEIAGVIICNETETARIKIPAGAVSHRDNIY